MEGVGPWWWIKSDTGAWNGPQKEFRGIRDLFKKNCKKFDVIVQAGGCLGMYPRLWAETFKTVYTFELDPLNFYCLQKNCQGMIQSGRIWAYNMALGDQPDEVWVSVDSMVNVGMHRAIRTQPAGDWPKIPQTRIDDIGLIACDAIQLDVESYESYVLEGARETIRKFQPIISLETVDVLGRTILVEEGYHEVGRHVSDSFWAPKNDK